VIYDIVSILINNTGLRSSGMSYLCFVPNLRFKIIYTSWFLSQ